MSAVVQQNQTRPANPLAAARTDVEKMEGQFKMALPAHIPVERFARVVMTAVGSNPDLLRADRTSLLEASLKAAQDGLLPDGRDGALVIYGQKVQWMPMIAGILKKVRNSGELLSISAYVAHEKDKFFYRLGDDETIEHEPFLDGDPGKPRIVYAVAKTKDGGTYREVMTVAEVEKIRQVSKAKNAGPWTQWWGEMARKTVLRRLAKRLPMSTDLDDVIRRDDALYDFEGARRDAQHGAPRSLAGKLDQLARSPQSDAPQIEHDSGDVQPEPAKVTSGSTARGHTRAQAEAAMSEHERTDEAPRANSAGPSGDLTDADDGRFPPVEGEPVDPIAEARQRGAEAKEAGLGTRAMPGEYRAEGREAEAEAWMAGHKAASAGSVG
jgi:recombination protein RecT